MKVIEYNRIGQNKMEKNIMGQIRIEYNRIGQNIIEKNIMGYECNRV